MIAERDSTASGLILAIDVGNSTTSLALIREGQASDRRDAVTENTKAVHEAVSALWKSTAADDHCRIVCGSVVPAVLADLRQFCKKNLGQKLVAIKEDIDFAMGLDLSQPETVGVDRVCAATAAYDIVKQACAVADFGTAITIDMVGDDGVFLGGTILPGIELSAKVLHESTAALPLVEVHTPDGVLGKDTASAINNGVFLSAVGALREIVERIATEIGRWPTLVATGGYAQKVADHSQIIDKVVPNLCLLGIGLTYQMHEAAEQD